MIETGPSATAASAMVTVRWPALGTTALLRVPARDATVARATAEEVLDEIDALASRFRDDSELQRLNAAAGEWMGISPGLADLLSLALGAAEVTGGAVDPTLGAHLIRLGYDRDVAQLTPVDPQVALATGDGRGGRVDRTPAWRRIALSPLTGLVRLPAGVVLDLGATAKGRAADLVAGAVHAATDGPVLVSLGGDIAVAGPPPEPAWLVAIADDHRQAPETCAEAVAIRTGGLATSSLLTRRWWHGGRPMHHVLDPRDGRPVTPHWVTVTVAAAECAEANIAATAALVLGAGAVDWLEQRALPARLVAVDREITRLAGWPG